MRFVCASVGLVACSLTDYTVGDGGADVVVIDSSSDVAVDVFEAGGPCDLTQPFSGPIAVSGIGGFAYYTTLRLTHDELTGYYAVGALVDGGGSNADLYVASRTSIGGSFGSGTPLGATINTSSHEDAPTITADGLALYFARRSTVTDGKDSDIYVSKRAKAGDAFGTAVAFLATNVPELSPYVVPDGTGLYYSTFDTLAHATNGTTDSGATFAAIDALVGSSYSNVDRPVVTPDELTLYFAGYVVFAWHTWRSTRTSTASAWSTPTSVDEVNSLNPYPDFVSDDGCRLYLESGGHLYVATKPK